MCNYQWYTGIYIKNNDKFKVCMIFFIIKNEMFLFYCGLFLMVPYIVIPISLFYSGITETHKIQIK